jgi:hypothetical protein
LIHATGIDNVGWPNLTAFDDYHLNIEHQLDIEYVMEVAALDVVWFADPGKIGPSPVDVSALTSAASIEFTGHLVSPEAILAIARECDGISSQTFVPSIRRYEFEWIEAPTPAAPYNLHDALGHAFRPHPHYANVGVVVNTGPRDRRKAILVIDTTSLACFDAVTRRTITHAAQLPIVTIPEREVVSVVIGAFRSMSDLRCAHFAAARWCG